MPIACVVYGESSRDLVASLSAALSAGGIEVADLNGRSPFVLVTFDPEWRRRPEFALVELDRVVRVIGLSLANSTLHSSWRDVDDLLDADSPDCPQWIAARIKRWQTIEDLIDSRLVRSSLAGASPMWRAFLREAVECARFGKGPVLVVGETGTGKELVARLVHALDARTEKGDLVVVDCTNIAPDLAGSELFGHERGAFTGAVSARDGAVALANGGTLFLDEVGELPLTLQAQLLRTIQEGTYRRVGGNTWQRSRFRLVCATNRPLLSEVEKGRFRADLYHRVAGHSLRVPALRDRREDVPLIAEHLLREAAAGGEIPPMSPALAAHLTQRDYPGNVRELRRLVHAMMDRYVGIGPLTPGLLPDAEARVALRSVMPAETPHELLARGVRALLDSGLKLKDIGRIAEDLAIGVAIDEALTQRDAAERLGVSERTIQLRRAEQRMPPSDISAV